MHAIKLSSSEAVRPVSYWGASASLAEWTGVICPEQPLPEDPCTSASALAAGHSFCMYTASFQMTTCVTNEGS